MELVSMPKNTNDFRIIAAKNCHPETLIKLLIKKNLFPENSYDSDIDYYLTRVKNDKSFLNENFKISLTCWLKNKNRVDNLQNSLFEKISDRDDQLGFCYQPITSFKNLSQGYFYPVRGSIIDVGFCYQLITSFKNLSQGYFYPVRGSIIDDGMFNYVLKKDFKITSDDKLEIGHIEFK